jgi:serine/threonine-protein kinase
LQNVAQMSHQQIGRYAIFDQLAAGGMATVHIARLVGPEGFSRVVAAKRMHRHLLESSSFKRMFLEEALLAARVRHPNVVPILDVLSHDGELIIVMEYVHGESLLALNRPASERFPIPVASAILVAALQGLHAAHEARNEKGEPLRIVHRDVSPHNILVGADGVARVVDFGVAKALHAREDTQPGVLKGKFSYMAPEVARGEPPSRQGDVFSAAIVFWELLAGRKLFTGTTDHERLIAVVSGNYPSVRQFNADVSPKLEAIVARGLALDMSQRYASALDFAIDIERALALAPQRVVGAWVQERAGHALEARAELIRQIETSSVGLVPAGLATEGTHPSGTEMLGAVRSQYAAEPRKWRVSPTLAAAVGLAAALASTLTWLAKTPRASANRDGNPSVVAAARGESVPLPSLSPPSPGPEAPRNVANEAALAAAAALPSAATLNPAQAAASVEAKALAKAAGVQATAAAHAGARRATDSASAAPRPKPHAHAFLPSEL